VHWFRRRKIYDDLSDEIRQHLDEKIEGLIADGMSRKDAELEARREFGNVTLIEESSRAPWTWPRTESLLSDIKFALRKLPKSPGFALTAILTLALGIGTNVVVFSVLNALILRPLAVPQQENLYLVRSQMPPDQVASVLHRALTRVEPGAPFTIRSWSDAIDLSMIPAHAATAVLGIMGLLAALLAVTGVFGMASYSVSKRMREHGIRVALGARPIQVVRATLGKPILLLLSGSALGLIAGVLSAQLLAHLVSFATPRDPLILAGVLVTMTLLGAVATWIPACRALSIDPVRLLRE
jgi:FtsX-like permease family protein